MASQAQQAKVLRIGIIMDGKIVQERLIKAGQTVTVGESAKNGFVLPKSHLPKAEFPIFVAKGNTYVLNFTEQMKGKISSNGAVVGLEKVRTDPSVPQQQGIWKLPLSDQDRGKISVDNITVLFQFVPAPPVQNIRPIQAMDFRPRLYNDDDGLLLAFMALFTAIGFVFMIYVWNTTPHEITSIDEIDERYRKLIITPPDIPVDTPKATAADAPKKEEKKKPEDKPKEAKVDQPQHEETAAERQARADALKKRLEQSSLVIQFLSTRGDSNSGTTKDLFGQEDTSNVDNLVKGASGTVSANDTNVGSRKGNTGGTSDAGIGKADKIGGGNAQIGAAPEVKVQTRVDVEAGDAGDMPTDAQGKLKQVVQRNAGQLKYCYDEHIKTNPNLAGRVEIEWAISGGRVTSADVFANTTGDNDFAQCIVSKIQRWSFPPEIQGQVQYPFVFKQQQ